MAERQEYNPVSTDENGDVINSKDERAYALSAGMVLLFSVLIIGAHANVATGAAFATSGWRGVYISASAANILGCFLALIFYCCDTPKAVRFPIGCLIILGGLLYFMAGAAGVGKSPQSLCHAGTPAFCPHQIAGFYLALPFLVLAECIILAMQIATEIIDDERRRIAAQVASLFIYGVCRAFFWYGFLQKKLNAAEKAAEAGLSIVMIVSLIVLVFHGLCCNIEAQPFRVATAILMSAGAFIYLVSWIAIANDKAKNNIYIGPFSKPASKLEVITPAIFVFLETINLAAEVGKIG